MGFERDDYQRDRQRYEARGDAPRQDNPGRSDRYNRDHDNRDERGFFDRAGDEVRSWFGDEDAERRRERDDREYSRGGQQGSHYGRPPERAHQDPHYNEWRQRQIDSLDRDYDEYRRHHQSKFDNEFGSWRTQRQTQRSSLDRVEEKMEVVGSDDQHIGVVDKVRGDRIILTKNDPSAGGHHHSIPSLWIETVDEQVRINKTADEAMRAWRDEDRNSALFGGDDDRTFADRNQRGQAGRNEQSDGPHMLNRSFSGTY